MNNSELVLIGLIKNIVYKKGMRNKIKIESIKTLIKFKEGKK